jgi:subtilisin family serine protease
MPLGSAGIKQFATAHPLWDGRGVLIAIMDSGIDPGIPGLGTTSDGNPKILDLRDFSGEGHVALQRVARHGDTLFIGNHHLLGAAAVAGVAGDAAVWGGALYEVGLGKAPAADLNGNGMVGDTLLIVVTKTSLGWALFADTDGDGSLGGERPIHDYLVAHEIFSWHGAKPAPVHLAANLVDSGDGPLLDLFFDTSSHGSHVSGIAAGHDIYGVAGFDGVAPGAKLIGLKISDDAHGPVSVTGSMVRALDYAIRFATARSMPLVVNLSFGVGNEIEGTARIDAEIDSILGAHPDVVMTIAAGNDGPGLSTLGFPASAARAIAVGATLPGLFMGGPPGDASSEMVAPFSSRGGELNGPDIAVPGAAYSTVPNYAIGDELENGTSMASPFAAGLAARLLSAAHAADVATSASLVRQALRMGARMLPSAFRSDDGAGLPDLERAWSWLSATHEYSELAVQVGTIKSRGAVFLTAPVSAGAHALGERVALRRVDGAGPMTVRLATDATWLQLPETVILGPGGGAFTAAVRPDAFTTPGVLQGVIRVEGRDETAGSLAVIPVTVRVPVPAAGTRAPLLMHQSAGGTGRVFIPADTGRGVQLEVATLRSTDRIAAALHEPGGMPFRDDRTLAAGFGDGAGVFDIDASDVAPGLYELDIQGSAFGPTDAKVTVRQSPLRLGAIMLHDTLLVTARNLLGTPVPVRLRAGLIGGVRHITVRGSSAAVRVAIAVPSWAERTVIDSRMAPEAWGRFTDFGLSFLDRQGREFDSSPINYAFSRAVPALPESVVGDTLFVLLSPGFADSLDHAQWTLDLDVRFYVEKPFSLDAGGSAMKSVAGNGIREERFVPGPIPIAFPADCAPLITVVALEGSERIWTREVVPTRVPGVHR